VAQDRGSNIETSFEELRLDYYSERRKSAEGQPIPITIMSTQNGFGTAAAVPEDTNTKRNETTPSSSAFSFGVAKPTSVQNPFKMSAPAQTFPVPTSVPTPFGAPASTSVPNTFSVVGSSNNAPAAASGGFAFGPSSPEAGSKAPLASGGFSFSFSSKSGLDFGMPATPTPVSGQPKEKSGAGSRKKINRAHIQNKTADSLEGYEHYRSFMDKLAESGVDDYVDLPMIAVMGDTSSGKSSLLSNISLVELPSSDTLTTRCPIRLQMRNAKSKKACVKVVWKDKPEGNNVDFHERTVIEESWSTLTDIIAEAQQHIISMAKKEVARDIVCVEVEGPHCENLTLIDLPGIVRSIGVGESADLAEDIQALMRDYLNNERCVILAVHPSNVDFHNSQILAEAKKVDPDTSRTIPVLTKPDLIDDGAEANVKDLLLGNKTDKFAMGFHMVKGRGQKDLNDDVGIEDGLTKEEAFFRNNEPWRNIEDKSKFGTKNLRVKLAGLQMKLIHESFESIISEMKERRNDAALELKALGDIPSTLIEKRALFRNVRDEMREGLGSESLNGRISQLHSSDAKRPSAEFHMASKAFREELNLSKLANISSIQIGTKIIAVVDGKEVRGSVCFVDDTNDNVFVKNKVIDVVKAKPGSVKAKPGSVFKSNYSVLSVRMDGDFDRLRPISRNLARSDPQWISELIEKNRPYNLPIFLNPDLFDAIVADQIEREWRNPTMRLLDFAAILMETASKRFINEIKMIKSLPSLTGFLVRKSSEVVESIKKDTEIEVSKFIEREQTPYTQNHYLFENLSKLRTQRLMDEVLSSVVTHGGNANDASTDKLAASIQGIFERNQKRSIDDHMAEEMQNALDSYGKVAFKRFVDNVPMICVQIMQRFPKMISDILSDLTDSDIDQLVVAPPGAITNMNALKKEVETLEKGIDTVKGLSSGSV